MRPDGHGAGWAELEARREEIAAWVAGEVPVVKIGILLGRQGVVVAERTLHRFAAERCGAGGSKVTTPVDDGPPGSELQIDFGDLGLIPAGEGRRRKLRALVFTACFSRYLFVYLTFSMTLEESSPLQDAWEFFGGVFRVVVPDNMSPVVARADAVDPRLTREWLEYAQARGFVTDPARVRHPRDKPRSAGVKYVQGNFFAGESFLDLADARARMAGWLGTANARVHGTTRQVPAVVFTAREAPCLLRPRPGGTRCRTGAGESARRLPHPGARALYSVPWRHVGARVMARADEHLVKVYLRDQLIRPTRARPPAAGPPMPRTCRRWRGMPPGPDRIVAQAASYGPATGTYARRLLDGDAPWMMMRSVYRLIGLAKRYARRPPRRPARGPWTSTSSTSPRSSRCSRTPPRTPRQRAWPQRRHRPGRFARDAAEYATATGIRLQVLDGGSDTADAGS